MVVQQAEAGPGPWAMTTQAPGWTEAVHRVQWGLWAEPIGVEPARFSDTVCDVIPYGTTNRVWDDKSLCVASCRQVTMGLCVTELGTQYTCVHVTP